MCWIFTGKNSRFRHKIPNSVFLKYFHKLEFLDKKWTIGPLWQVEKMGESHKSHFIKWQVNVRSKKWTIWGSKWNVFIKLISNETFKKSSSNGQINKSSSQMTVFDQKLDFHPKLVQIFPFYLMPHENHVTFFWVIWQNWCQMVWNSV